MTLVEEKVAQVGIVQVEYLKRDIAPNFGLAGRACIRSI